MKLANPLSALVFGLFAMFAVVMLSGGCSSEPESACASGEVECDGTCIPAIAATAAAIHSDVMAKGCAFSSCHGNSNPKGGLDLSTVDGMLAAVDKDSTQVKTSKVIAAGDPAGSYLLDKLKGLNLAKNTTVMPPAGKLCQPKLDAVEAWIKAGAPK